MLADRLHRADELTAIDASDLIPWHLKLNVQLYDAKGKPAEAGTIEEFWAGPKMWSISYALPSYSGTWIQNAEGLYRTEGIGSAPMLLTLLLDEVVHPMPPPHDVDQSTPELRKITFGKTPLECVMLSQPIKTVPFVPMGLFPTYCFDPGKDSLRASYDFGSQLILRNAMGIFQKHSVATDVMVSSGNFYQASAHVETLTTAPMEESKFTVPEQMRLVGTTARIGAGIMAGTIVSKVQPIYPASARANHVSGTVVMRALIGRDGHVHSLKLVSVPDPDLAIAAVAAVRQWTYKPYLINGEPVEVDTTITVNFNLSPM
jgi:TonB family protein